VLKRRQEVLEFCKACKVYRKSYLAEVGLKWIVVMDVVWSRSRMLEVRIDCVG